VVPVPIPIPLFPRSHFLTQNAGGLAAGWNYKCHCHCNGVTASTGTEARPFNLLCWQPAEWCSRQTLHFQYNTSKRPMRSMSRYHGSSSQFAFPFPHIPRDFSKFQSRSCVKSRASPAGHFCSRCRSCAKLYFVWHKYPFACTLPISMQLSSMWKQPCLLQICTFLVIMCPLVLTHSVLMALMI